MSIQAVAWVLEHSSAELGARLALLSIANHADRAGCNSFPSYETIGGEARITRRAAIDAVARLERDGHITVEKQASTYGTNVYRVLGVASEVTSPPDVGGSEAGGEVDDTLLVKLASPEPSFNRLTAVPNSQKPKRPVDNRTWAQKESDRRYGGEGARFLETTPEYIAEVEAKAEPPDIKVPKVVRPEEAARARSLIQA